MTTKLIYTIPLMEQADLTVLLTQPFRKYHNIYHINDLLAEMYRWHSASALHRVSDSDCDPVKVLSYTIWYHDAIYNPYSPPGLNEQQSAELFRKEHERDLNEGSGWLHLVRSAILRTAYHTETQIFNPKESGNDLMMTMLDLDLAGLGKSPRIFFTNGLDIRDEYYLTPDMAFLKGRLGFFTKLLQRESFYYTEYFKSLYDAQSRENVNREVKLIELAISKNNPKLYFEAVVGILEYG